MNHLPRSPSLLPGARLPVGLLIPGALAGALFGLLVGCGGGGTAALDSATPPVTTPPSPTAPVVRITGVEPEHPDASGDVLLIRGEGLGGAIVFTLEDVATGRRLALGAGLPAADGSGRRVATPPLAGVGTQLPARLVARQADGTALTVARTVVFRRVWASIDGAGNNVADPDQNLPGTALARRLPAAYGDGIASLGGADRPNPRAISNAVCAQAGDEPNAQGASDMLWQWGQFLDHDLDLTPDADPAEPAFIAIPSGDPAFDPFATGEVVLPFLRSAWVQGLVPRQQVQAITGWIDASNVYGSDAARAAALRTVDGTGRLRTSAGGLLPFNTAGLPNAGGTDAALFLAGDVRANEQVGLTVMHTLFVREHNRQVAALAARHPELDGDALYQEARRRVAALVQVITQEEFLPLLVGRGALGRWTGYDATLDARIDNAFSTAAYRLGHSLLSPVLLRLDASGLEVVEGHLSLRDAFFAPERLVTEGGIEPVLRGLAAQAAQELDTHVVDDVRNFLFGPPGAGGLDLAALNLQRGRDHGLPTYAVARAALGLAPRDTFEAIARDAATAAGLASVYRDPADVDLWVGALAEAPVEGAMVGELLQRLLVDPFRRLRDGDRHWYEGTFDPEEVRELRATRLADVIRRNTGIGAELDDDVFRVGDAPRARPPAPPGLPGALTVRRVRAAGGGGLR